LLGEIRMSQNRSNDGVALCQRAAILSPKNASYQSRLGNALLQSMEEVEESRRGLLAGQALTALRRSVELDPEDCDGYLGLANFYAAVPEAAGSGYDKAIQAAGELKKRKPLDGAITAAGIAEQHGRLEAALAFYREVLQLFSGSPDLRACEPRILARLGRTAEARKCYEKILEDFPGWEPARAALAGLPQAQ
jgi:tetratricopeptide (TPR) repeat protein